MARTVILFPPEEFTYHQFACWMNYWQKSHAFIDRMVVVETNGLVTQYCHTHKIRLSCDPLIAEKIKPYEVIGFDLDMVSERICRRNYRRCFNYSSESVLKTLSKISATKDQEARN